MTFKNLIPDEMKSYFQFAKGTSGRYARKLLYKTRIRGSDQLKTVLTAYELEI